MSVKKSVEQSMESLRRDGVFSSDPCGPKLQQIGLICLSCHVGVEAGKILHTAISLSEPVMGVALVAATADDPQVHVTPRVLKQFPKAFVHLQALLHSDRGLQSGHLLNVAVLVRHMLHRSGCLQEEYTRSWFYGFSTKVLTERSIRALQLARSLRKFCTESGKTELDFFCSFIEGGLKVRFSSAFFRS